MISSGPSTQRALRRHAWMLPTALGVVAIIFLCWGAWQYGYRPDWLSHRRAWYRDVLAPDQDVTLVVTVMLWLAGLVGYWLPRRRRGQPIGLIVAVVMMLVAAALGGASYIPCRGQVSVLGVTFWIIQLYVGQPPNIYQNVSPATSAPYPCYGPPPLGLQLAQLDGLAATLLIGALAAAAVLWRQPIERLRSRFSREVTIFTGLDMLTLPLLRLLAAPGPERIVVIEPDETHTLLDEARATGAVVIIGDPWDPGLLEPIISAWRGCALRYLYAMRSEPDENNAVLDLARELLYRYPPQVGELPHLIARVDNPRHANSWRGTHVGTSGMGLEDALSPVETTAHALVASILEAQARELIICGDSGLTIAVLLELDRRRWERRELATAADNGRLVMPDEPTDGLPLAMSVSRVLLMDIKAAESRREYLAGLPEMEPAHPPGATRFAESVRPTISVREVAWQDELLSTLDALPKPDAQQTAVLIADGFSESAMQTAGRLASLHPGIHFYVQAPSGEGVSEPIFDQLHLYRLGLLVAGGVPEDTWTRIARHWHECHRRENPVPKNHPKAGSRVPWSQLDRFVTEDNILQVRSIMLAVAGRLHRLWIPARALLPGSFIELTDRELDTVAEIEHTRWFRRQAAFGKSNPLAVPWPDLSPEDRRAERDRVQRQVSRLEDAGFLPIVPKGGPAGVEDYERIGIVSAKRLTTPLRWTISSGEELRGDAGDWQVDNEHGEMRTVTDPEFQASHEPVGNGQWRRVGTFRAWQVTEPVRLRTKEGSATADPGDWVVESPAGERWPVSEQQFERTYRPVRDAPGENRPD